MKLHKIISGGQTGVDQGALLAAMNCNVQTGGWCPPGRLCETGTIPEHFHLTETPDDCSSEAPEVPRSLRTEWNIRDSDGTLILEPSDPVISDKGTEWTKKCCRLMDKPVLVADPTDETIIDKVNHWIKQERIKTLNIAGPAESSWPGAERFTRQIVYKLINSGNE